MEDNFKDFVVEYADCRMLTVNLVYRMDYLPPGNQQDCTKRFVNRFLDLDPDLCYRIHDPKKKNLQLCN